MILEEMIEKLKSSLKKERFEHSMRVYEIALKMAKWYGMSKDKIEIAALLHDCGRAVPTADSVTKCKEFGIAVDEVEMRQPILLHQKLGRYYAQKYYGVSDEEILDAIGRHTTGGKGMGPVAKVVYLADIIEDGRDFPGVDELRAEARKGLDQGLKKCYAHTLHYLVNAGLLVHPDSVDGYNELVLGGEQK